VTEIARCFLSLSSRDVSSEIAEFPLPADVTDDERATAKREIGKYAKILGEEPRVIRFAGRTIGQTGPVWHFAAHDLHEGIKVAYAERPDDLPKAFENDLVREFVEDELRYRKIIGSEHARAE